MKYLKTYEQKEGITFKEWVNKNRIGLNYNSLTCSYSKLTDLYGIEEFVHLKFLNCSNNYLEDLPDFSNLTGLIYFNCSNNRLTKLPDSGNFENLQSLNCSDNNLTELPDLSNLKQLVILKCSGNDLPFYSSEFNNNLPKYLEWHKKEYPYLWDGKKYNL